MKRILHFFVLLLFLSTSNIFGDPGGGGELLVRIINPVSNKINFYISAEDYVWDWINQMPVRISGDNRSFLNKEAVSFTAPKNGSASNKIYWGFYQMTVESLNSNEEVIFSLTFYLDLRDEGWSISGQGGYQGVDTYLRIDQQKEEIYLDADHNGYYRRYQIQEGWQYEIWDLWAAGTPEQINFTVPVSFKNRIRYQIPEDGVVTLKIFDILGKEVTTLVNESKTTGRYELNFNASNLASGVYIYRIQVNDFVTSKKMMLLKESVK
jgi:hypothetical protein